MKSATGQQQQFSVILFDLGNVLVKVDYPAFLRSLGFDRKMSEGELYRLLEEESRAYEAGRVSPEEYLARLNTKLRTSYSFKQFKLAWNSILPDVVPGVPDLADSLRARYRLMVLSNTNKVHFDHMLELLPVLRHFECFFLSFQIGALKPDPAIYRHVLSRVDVPVEQLLFIDDLEVNVEAAQKLGIRGIVFQGLAPLKTELQRLSVV